MGYAYTVFGQVSQVFLLNFLSTMLLYGYLTNDFSCLLVTPVARIP